MFDILLCYLEHKLIRPNSHLDHHSLPQVLTNVYVKYNKRFNTTVL